MRRSASTQASLFPPAENPNKRLGMRQCVGGVNAFESRNSKTDVARVDPSSKKSLLPRPCFAHRQFWSSSLVRERKLHERPKEIQRRTLLVPRETCKRLFCIECQLRSTSSTPLLYDRERGHTDVKWAVLRYIEKYNN